MKLIQNAKIEGYYIEDIDRIVKKTVMNQFQNYIWNNFDDIQDIWHKQQGKFLVYRWVWEDFLKTLEE